MAKSHRIGLPFLSAGQAQKELLHNEALILLDAVVQGCCEGGPLNSPPEIPEQGLSYLCGNDPIGEWAGRPRDVACWSDSGWRFITPFDGLQMVDRSNGCTWRFMAGQWSSGIVRGSELHLNGVRVVGDQYTAIANVSGGTVVDTQARDALAQVLSALRSHGLIASA
ncbi:hypothetical protein GGQ97_002720 [Sphingomonas kaistensis]|uniref:DUF2793 domain-containing protein n=1 Tax=Sphingomonas kaistensis TaxID=298708 RepID=A0A7X5Y858_9SPHN|nr:DUF2793 domain-containing protein [Sphingomonas kaistensis]NJC06927.1 hypothetical protein [Sphingomonas kaistensis]